MQQQSTITTAEISLKDITGKIKSFFSYVTSKWLMLLGISLVGAAIGITYAWLQKAKYEAVLSFSMEDNKTSAGGLAGIASQFGVDIGSAGSSFSGDNIMVLIQSNKLIESTLLSKVTINGAQKSLLNIYLDFSEMNKGFKKSSLKEIRELSFPENQDASQFTRLQDSILLKIIDNILKKNIDILKPFPKLNFYKLTCTTTDENFSTEFCKGLIKQVTDFYIETKTKRSANIVEILQKRADSIKSAYDNALIGRAELSDANINAAFQTPVVGIQRKQTDITVLGAAYGEVLKNLEVAKFNMLNDAPLIQVIDTPLQPLEKKKLGRLLGGLIVAFAFGSMSVLVLFFKFITKKPAPLNVTD